MYKVDLHIHTSIGSSCSVLSLDELVEGVRLHGLDAIAITDHNTIYGAIKTKEEFKRRGIEIPVLEGIEVRSNVGDVLVFGIYEDDPVKLDGIDLDELYEMVKSVGGVIIAAHPFRKNAASIGNKIYDYLHVFDAIEVFNENCSEEEQKDALGVAVATNYPITASSDAHSQQMLGRYYTLFPTLPRSTYELIAMIKRREFSLPSHLEGKKNELLKFLQL